MVGSGETWRWLIASIVVGVVAVSPFPGYAAARGRGDFLLLGVSCVVTIPSWRLPRGMMEIAGSIPVRPSLLWFSLEAKVGPKIEYRLGRKVWTWRVLPCPREAGAGSTLPTSCQHPERDAPEFVSVPRGF